jgi:hypothetical protein
MPRSASAASTAPRAIDMPSSSSRPRADSCGSRRSATNSAYLAQGVTRSRASETRRRRNAPRGWSTVPEARVAIRRQYGSVPCPAPGPVNVRPTGWAVTSRSALQQSLSISRHPRRNAFSKRESTWIAGPLARGRGPDRSLSNASCSLLIRLDLLLKRTARFGLRLTAGVTAGGLGTRRLESLGARAMGISGVAHGPRAVHPSFGSRRGGRWIDEMADDELVRHKPDPTFWPLWPFWPRDNPSLSRCQGLVSRHTRR